MKNCHSLTIFFLFFFSLCGRVSDPRIMYICSMMLCDTMLCIGLLSNYIFRSVDVNIDIVQLSRCIIGFNDIM